jgi:hypothetical protein
VFTVLQRIVRVGIRPETASKLRDGFIHWFIQQQQDKLAGSRYGNWALRDCKSVKRSRIAWCYGDLGIGALLLQASEDYGQGRLTLYAQELLNSCAKRAPDGVTEPTLCHGSSGVAHIFNRAYQETGNINYLEAAQQYFDLTLSFLEDTRLCGVIGDGFLDGVIGIALALTSAICPIEPKWDRLLMLSCADSHDAPRVI